MRYFYEDVTSGRVGPYTAEELRQLHLAGTVKPDTLVFTEGEGSPQRFHEFWAKSRSTPSGTGATPSPKNFSSTDPSFAERAAADLKALTPHLLVPWEEFKTFSWFENRKLISIAGIGLLPLLIIALFGERGDIRSAYWAIAFYFSALWAVFFYNVFPAPRITIKNCLICFFGTGLVAISLLLVAYRLPPLSWIITWTGSNDFIVHWLGYVLAVGIPEEACKVAVLFFISKKEDPQQPHTLLFYGLMAGLGFGIYEGVNYQMGRNISYSSGLGEYYLLNILRLTTLPFLHAIWTGIAAYFIGFAMQYPQRKAGLLIFAIGLPALLHGTYDAVRSTLFSLLLALFSVLALTLYLAKSVDFEKALGERK